MKRAFGWLRENRRRGSGDIGNGKFGERLRHSLKQEEVYRRAHKTVAKARKEIADYLGCFDEERPHQGLDNRTPDEVYYGLDGKLPKKEAA
ncbi:MAG: transposase [Bacteroidetes bacterium SB0662_bin_6]|nr:transposase [Bacteroidetes bacterium SB0668_bin_1]MYE04132.1 transposase [Bacteroidetes bacterium SB0662_bin_6]